MSEESSAKPRPRIQTLSDLVFGLALSISALTLIGQQPATIPQLSFFLGLYGFSFLILISVWRVYSSITSILPVETSFLTGLNIILLFTVSIEPYLFNELFTLRGELYSYVTVVYSLDLAAMFLILAFFSHFLANEERKIVPKTLLRKYKYQRNLCLLQAAIFLVSMASFFGDFIVLHTMVGATSYDLNFRGVLWIVALLVGFSAGFLERYIKS